MVEKHAGTKQPSSAVYSKKIFNSLIHWDSANDSFYSPEQEYEIAIHVYGSITIPYRQMLCTSHLKPRPLRGCG